MAYPLTRKQISALAKAAPERRESLEAAFQRQNESDRMFALEMAAGKYEALEIYIGRV